MYIFAALNNFCFRNKNIEKGIMYIQSKYKQKSFLEISLANERFRSQIADTGLHEVNLGNNNFQVSSLTTSNFCLLKHLSVKQEDANFSIQIESSYVFIIVILNGSVKFENAENCNQLNESSIYYGFGKDTHLNFKILSEEDVRLYAYFFKRDYIFSLLTQEEWSNDWNFTNQLHAHEKNSSLTCLSTDFSAPLYHSVLELAQQQPESKLELFLMDITIKKMFLQFRINETDKGNMKIENPENLKKIKAAHQYLLKNFTNSPTIKQLSREVILNELQLKKDFKIVYGTTIRKLIIDLKMKKANALLQKNTVAETAHQLGYKSIPHFINKYKTYYGFTPSKKLKK